MEWWLWLYIAAYPLAFTGGKLLVSYLNRRSEQTAKKPSFTEQDRHYLECLNALNIEFPTDDPEEKALAKYLEQTNSRSSGVSGSYQQLLSPGLSALFNQRSRTVPGSSLNDINPYYQQQATQLQNAAGLQDYALGQDQRQLGLGGVVGPMTKDQLDQLFGRKGH